MLNALLHRWVKKMKDAMQNTLRFVIMYDRVCGSKKRIQNALAQVAFHVSIPWHGRSSYI